MSVRMRIVSASVYPSTMARTRSFPFSPSSATQLEVGDLVGVQSDSGKWGCLQVVDLEPRARTTLWAGLLDWSADVAAGR